MSPLRKNLKSGHCLGPSLMGSLPGERSVFFSTSHGSFSGPFLRNLLFLLLFWLLPSHTVGQSNLPMGQMVNAFGDEKPYAQGFYEKAQAQHADPQWVMEVMGKAKLMRDQGLPTQPFFLKANEGLTKRVAPTKITPALDKTQGQIESANQLVSHAISRGAVVRSPEARRQSVLGYQRALMNEVPPSTLEKLSSRIDPQSLSKIRIDQLGEAAADFPKLKKQGLSDEAALSTFDKKFKEGGIAEKNQEAFPKNLPQKPFFEEKWQNKYLKEKEEKKSSVSRRMKGLEPSEKKKPSEKGPPLQGSPHGKSHGHGHGKGN